MTYNAEGKRITSENLAGQVTTTAWDCCLAYGYNNRSELTNAVAAVDSNYRYAYGFDDIGNREASSEGGTNSVYTASQLNQYTSISNLCDSASLREAFTPQFDDDGNQTLIKTATGIWQVSYNGENRPVFWENGTKKILMSYDRMGRRVPKNDHRFVYDGYLQIADIGGNMYIWDPTEKVATRPLAWLVLRSLGEGGYYTHDGNKNVSEVVAENGALAAHYEYAPFGAVIAQGGTSTATNPWRFSSEYTDDAIFLVYYNYRHYDPVNGRWIRRDPIMDLSVDYNIAINELISESIESYMFIKNSPLLHLDLTGLELITKSCECDSILKDGVVKANEALGKGKCKQWFEQHGHDFNSGLPNKTVVCHKYKLPCIAFPAWTMPFGRIGVCSGKIDDALVMASILIHELAHHYCTMFWGREDCAISAQDASAEEIR